MNSSIKCVALGFLYCTFLVWGLTAVHNILRQYFSADIYLGQGSYRQPQLWITAAQIWTTWRDSHIPVQVSELCVCVYDKCVQKMGIKSSPERSGNPAEGRSSELSICGLAAASKIKEVNSRCKLVCPYYINLTLSRHSIQRKFAQINV